MDQENLDKAFRASGLIVKYLATSLKDEELNSWTEESEENRMLFSELTDVELIKRDLAVLEFINESRKAVLRRVKRQISAHEGKSHKKAPVKKPKSHLTNRKIITTLSTNSKSHSY